MSYSLVKGNMAFLDVDAEEARQKFDKPIQVIGPINGWDEYCWRSFGS